MNKFRKSSRSGSGVLPHGMICILTCLLCLPLSAMAGENIAWNGPGDPANTGQLRPDPMGWTAGSLFPDGSTGNSVTVNGDVPDGDVYGGLDYQTGNTAAEAAGNNVTVSNGATTGNVNGGYASSYSGSAEANTNSVTVSNGATTDSVFGGSASSGSGSAEANTNSVTVSNSAINGSVNGGFASSGSGSAAANNNSVTVSNSASVGDVNGGFANSGSGSAAANNNSVTVSNGAINGSVNGGFAYSGSGSAAGKANNNSVTVSNGAINGNVYGGSASSGSGSAAANNNRVTVSNGASVGSVLGGFADSGSVSAEANNNSVTVSNSASVGDVNGGSASSGSGSAEANNNRVTVSNSAINGSVYGGIASSGSGSAEANNNSVTVSNGASVGNVYGGSASSGSGSAATKANNNSVTVSNSAINGSVFGGSASSGSGSATANNNSVTVSNGAINGDIFGGFAASDSGSAAGNTVTLSGSTVFAASTGLYGGFMNNHGTPATGADVFTGNTLNVWNYTGSSMNSVQNFQYYNFVLPASQADGSTIFMADTVYFDDSQSGAGSGVQSAITGVNIMGGGTPVSAGYSVALMEYNNVGGYGVYAGNGNDIVQGKKGVSLLYDWQLAQNENSLTATVLRVRAHPQAKALSEGRAAGLAFVNQGADLAAGQGICAARNARPGLGAFFAGQGGTSRYDTGSHVDVDGFSLMTGLAWNTDTEYGKLLLGAFFEAGWGNYDSHNSFSNYASVKGDGDTEYYGGGALGRFDFNAAGSGNIYAEASFRAGWSETDFSSSDLRDGIGQKADYDSGSAYYGAHAGIGYLWNIGQASSLDLYTKYFWTHQDSDSVSVTGDPVRFKNADSHRWRGGARFSHSLTTESGLVFTPYIGAAYEHEFDGKAKAAAYGYSIDAPDLKGGTGMGELGFSLKPSAQCGLSFDLGAQGYVGVREGVTGIFQLKWEF